jgi:hypothetical protein
MTGSSITLFIPFIPRTVCSVMMPGFCFLQRFPDYFFWFVPPGNPRVWCLPRLCWRVRQWVSWRSAHGGATRDGVFKDVGLAMARVPVFTLRRNG